MSVLRERAVLTKEDPMKHVDDKEAIELLRKAGFGDVRRVAYRQTASPYPEIVELDARPEESFYVEAFK